jgi:hypothetical protein
MFFVFLVGSRGSFVLHGADVLAVVCRGLKALVSWKVRATPRMTNVFV